MCNCINKSLVEIKLLHHQIQKCILIQEEKVHATVLLLCIEELRKTFYMWKFYLIKLQIRAKSKKTSFFIPNTTLFFMSRPSHHAVASEKNATNR